MSQRLITSDDKSPLVEILIWMLLAVSVITVTVRIVTKIAFVRKLELDDFLILASTFFAVPQAVIIWLSVSHGFAQRIAVLSPSEIESISQFQYAANILEILILCLIKLSILAFIRSLTAVRQHRLFVLILGGVVVSWTLASEFSMIFLCGIPKPWQYINNHETCLDRRITFWKAYAALNIATDAIEIGLILWFLLLLKTNLKRKITLCFVFASRALVIAVAIIQIFIVRQIPDSPDATFDLWPFVTITIAVQCISFVTACIPYLKPFLKSVESGLFRADDLHGMGPTTLDGYNRTPLGSKNKDLTSSTAESIAPAPLELDRFRSSQLQYSTSTATHDRQHAWDGQSHTSQSKMITQARTWAVKVEVKGENQSDESVNVH